MESATAPLCGSTYTSDARRHSEGSLSDLDLSFNKGNRHGLLEDYTITASFEDDGFLDDMLDYT